MIKILILSDREFKVAMINILITLMEKQTTCKNNGQYNKRGRNSKKVSKINSRIKKYCNIDERWL